MKNLFIPSFIIPKHVYLRDKGIIYIYINYGYP